jgi:hypothetical protein
LGKHDTFNSIKRLTCDQPPLQYFVIEAFDNMGNITNGAEMALKLAERWITSNFCGWNETLSSYGGLMFEKYNAET